jgi:hypothetical protein
MKPETFPHHQAVHDYAKTHGLELHVKVRLRALSPEQFQMIAVHTLQGMQRVILFSKGIDTQREDTL